MFAASKKSNGLIIAVMVLCILSACAAGILVMLSGPGIAYDVRHENYPHCCTGNSYQTVSSIDQSGKISYRLIARPDCYECDPHKQAKIGVQSFLIAVAIFEAIAAIWASALCCKTVCMCCSEPGAYSYGMPMQVQYVTGPVGGNHQVLFVPAPGAPPGMFSALPHGQVGYVMQTGPVMAGVPNQPQVYAYPGVPQLTPVQLQQYQPQQLQQQVGAEPSEPTAAGQVPQENCSKQQESLG
ncbi:uncharacterized protein LOC106164846 [Lingula anatina]|uniref:Uncharacterized protein LOC106164846 n=1 Tax=Lingula anatina TaxID=7574 RepID=A0A1S3IJP4_LINAN|nr:uncharacterized protein LOC106164846 [Lingula anatina]|eukprot:XP_013398333.1 uncharacterized protein LOC106164846 [Lingula anatina]